jgi:hypothetical protein
MQGNQAYAPIDFSDSNDEDEDELAFAMVDQPTVPSTTTTTDRDTGTSFVTPTYYSSSSHHENHAPQYDMNNGGISHQSTNGMHMPSTPAALISSTLNGITDVEKQTLVIATAIPGSIRPPRHSPEASTNPAVILVKRLSILLIGLFFCMISFFDALIFMAYSSYSTLWTISAICWFFSALALLTGSIYGCYVNQWRYLAPGIVCSHAASFLLKMS